VGKYLLALSASSDSLYIFCHLVKEIEGLDLKNLLFKGDQNIMHIVCENASILIFKWLVVNGYHGLFNKKCGYGLVPFHSILYCPYYGVHHILRTAKQFNILPNYWMELAKYCDNPPILKFMKEEQENQKILCLSNPDQLRDATIEDIQCLFENRDFRKKMRDVSSSLFFFKEVLAPSGRSDVFDMFIQLVQENCGVCFDWNQLKDIAYSYSSFDYSAYIDEFDRLNDLQKIEVRLIKYKSRIKSIFTANDNFSSVFALLKKYNKLIAKPVLNSKKNLKRNPIDLLDYDGKNFLTLAYENKNENLIIFLLKHKQFKRKLSLIRRRISDSWSTRIVVVVYDHLKSIGALRKSDYIEIVEQSCELLTCEWCWADSKSAERENDFIRTMGFILKCVSECKEILTLKYLNNPFIFFFFSCFFEVDIEKDDSRGTEFLSSQILIFLKALSKLGCNFHQTVDEDVNLINYMLMTTRSYCLASISFLAFEHGVSLKNVFRNSMMHEWEKEEKDRLLMMKRYQMELLNERNLGL
jgi:hypothetical protein